MLRVEGLGFGAQGLGCRVYGVKLRVQGSGFEGKDPGSRVEGLRVII